MHSVERSLSVLSATVSEIPSLLCILGSGWNKVLDGINIELEIAYGELFGVSASVPGHEGKLVIGTVKEKRVAFMAGRFHTYEGYSSEEVTRPIQVFAKAGMKNLVVTSAAGALNEKYKVGDFVILNDLITMFCQSPLIGATFTDMSNCFDAHLREVAMHGAITNGLTAHEGVYVYARGPHFETPADKMMLRHLGADVVGMSTVPETIMARSLGVRVLGISFVTNLAFVTHDHKDVLAAANKGSEQMVLLLKELTKQV